MVRSIEMVCVGGMIVHRANTGKSELAGNKSRDPGMK